MKYEKLCEELERKVMRTMQTPYDFSYLSEKIMEQTGEPVSADTLMRLWGYKPSVTARCSTLDILARFLGYANYTAFEYQFPPVAEEPTAPSDLESLSEESEPKSLSHQSSCRWNWLATVMLLVLLAVAGFFYFQVWKENDKYSPFHRQKSPIMVTSIVELSNTKQYYIHTLNKARGTLGVYQRQLATTFSRAQRHRCDSASTFALLQYEGDYYLYSVADQRFFNFGIHETDAPMSGTMCALVLHERDSCLVIDFKNTSTPCTVNVNEGWGIIVTDYGTINGMYDEGNLLQLEEAGDFDPTEALAMLKEPNEEFVAATKSITPEGNYAIYTCFDGSGKEGSTRYYLTASGHLTETLTDSCIFTFHRIEGDSLYRSPAWLIAYHATSAKDEASKRICFSNRIDLDSKQASPIGYLRSEPFFRNDWQGKVLYRNRQGYYAIRATAMPIEWWAAGSYWTVYDLDGDGCPEADYSEQRSYVWQLDSRECH